VPGGQSEQTMTVEDRKRVIDLIERVRVCQLPNGAVASDRVDEAATALREALTILRPYTNILPSLVTSLADMDEWLATGLDSTPNMRHLVKNGLTPIPEGAQDAFLTVTTTLNYSEGHSLEFVLYRRFEGAPGAALRQIHHCKYLVIAQLIDATAGFGMESNCIVCFTECLAGGGEAPDVMDVFFTSKNALRGKVLLQPIMERILAPNVFSELRNATLDDLRLTVPCKTVTHEWSHRQGVIPLTEFRVLFDNFIGAGLEEARVELNGAYILYTYAEQGGPHAAIYNMAAQFIIADRLFRYPYAAHPSDNADAVSGQYFLGQFIDKGLLTCNAGGVFLAGRTEMIRGLAQILAEIEQTQYRAIISGIPQAHQAFRDHVAQYSPALDENNTMQRSLFYAWMEKKLKDTVPPAMDWKAAIAEHGE
jgi:hypothetical protein